MLSDNVLEQLIDCREDDMPSPRTVQLMASELMRIRSYGKMIPAAPDELKQRAIAVMVALENNEKITDVLRKVSDRVKSDIHVDLFKTMSDVMLHIIGDEPIGAKGGWMEVSTHLLQDIERVIQDAVGFGKSHSTKTHNSALNNLHKFIQNSGASSTVIVPREFLEHMAKAIDDIVYGNKISQGYRDQIVTTIHVLLAEESDNEKKDEIHDQP